MSFNLLKIDSKTKSYIERTINKFLFCKWLSANKIFVKNIYIALKWIFLCDESLQIFS
jgi:hypothetical protein